MSDKICLSDIPCSHEQGKKVSCQEFLLMNEERILKDLTEYYKKKCIELNISKIESHTLIGDISASEKLKFEVYEILLGCERLINYNNQNIEFFEEFGMICDLTSSKVNEILYGDIKNNENVLNIIIGIGKKLQDELDTTLFLNIFTDLNFFYKEVLIKD